MSKGIIPMTFYTLEPKEIQESLSIIFQDKENLEERIKLLSSDHILIPLKQEDFEIFNPNTLTCPTFRIKKDLEILRHIYNQTSILIERDSDNGEITKNSWNITFKRLFDIAGDSKLFLNQENLRELNAFPLNVNTRGSIWVDKKENRYLPLYSGKMIWTYDHRYQSEIIDTKRKQRSLKPLKNSLDNHKNRSFSTITAYKVEEKYLDERVPADYNHNWFLAYRSIVSTDNRRMLISTIIPRTAVAHTIIVILSNKTSREICCLLANLNSIVFDYVLKQKCTSNFLSNFITEQLPVFPPDFYNKKLREIINNYVLKLVYTANDLKDFAKDIGFSGDPFEWDPNKRAINQAGLDALFFHLYQINRIDLEYILDTFDILMRKELEKFNEYKTKRLILDAYDKFSKQKELFE